MSEIREATIERDTTETQIRLTLRIDGSGKSEVSTGVPFFDHMLTLLARHGPEKEKAGGYPASPNNNKQTTTTALHQPED